MIDSPKYPDNVVKDIVIILTHHGIDPEHVDQRIYNNLIGDLCVYIAGRDYEVVNHGMGIRGEPV